MVMRPGEDLTDINDSKQKVTMKFRKKPVVIEAMQLCWDTWSEICNFVPKEWFGGGVYVHRDGSYHDLLLGGSDIYKLGLLIKTLELPMLATEGDWIIKGVKGEFYPCKPDIFEQTYELVSEE